MSNDRKNIGDNQNTILFNQVQGLCPFCNNPLMYNKGDQTRKGFQVAHIYPLNPSDEEIELLKDEERLSEDVNSLDNLIPICLNCHNKFDHPRTVEEYRILYNIKKNLIEKEKLNRYFSEYHIEEEIQQILNELFKLDITNPSIQLNYTPVTINKKLKPDFDHLLARNIENYVSDYYLQIKNICANLDITSGKFNLIATQIKSLYLKFSSETENQKLIYEKMTEWLQRTTKASSDTACEIVISFFIQNCEVFEDVTK